MKHLTFYPLIIYRLVHVVGVGLNKHAAKFIMICIHVSKLISGGGPIYIEYTSIYTGVKGNSHHN